MEDERKTGVELDLGNTERHNMDGSWSYLKNKLDSPEYFKKYIKTSRFGVELINRLLRRWQPVAVRPARLALIARILVGPRQAIALIEAEGMQLLVATSAEGTPSFYPLHSSSHLSSAEASLPSVRNAVVSDKPNSWAADRPIRLIKRVLNPGDRIGRRLGSQGRVSW